MSIFFLKGFELLVLNDFCSHPAGKATNARIVKNLRQNNSLRVENRKSLSHKANSIAPLFSGAPAPSTRERSPIP